MRPMATRDVSVTAGVLAAATGGTPVVGAGDVRAVPMGSVLSSLLSKRMSARHCRRLYLVMCSVDEYAAFV